MAKIISRHYIQFSHNLENHVFEYYLLQMVLGIIQALTSEETSRLELLISLEKLILQNIAVSRDSTSVLGQVIVTYLVSYTLIICIIFHKITFFLSNIFS